MKNVAQTPDQKKLTLNQTTIKALGPRVRTGIQAGSLFKHSDP